MRSGAARLLLLAAALAASGCASSGPNAFAWPAYEDRLCRWFRERGDPAVEAGWLTETIRLTEAAGRPVPPGVRAHAGYLWSLAQDPGQAAGLYRAERDAFPESAVLMEGFLARMGP